MKMIICCQYLVAEINIFVSFCALKLVHNQANYDDVTTQLYRGSFVVVVVVVVFVVVVVVIVVVAALLVVTDHIIFSCSQ